MRKFSICVALVAIAIGGTAGAASATGSSGSGSTSGSYATAFPTVAPSTTSVQPSSPFTATAKNFCAGKPVTITLVNLQHTYSKTVTASSVAPIGQAVASFVTTGPGAVAPGLYLIIATSGSPCNRIALSYIEIKGTSSCSNLRTNTNNNNGCSSHHFSAFSLGTGTPADIDAMVASLASVNSSAAVQAAVLSESISAQSSVGRTANGATLPVTGSDSVSTVQLALVALLAGFGMVIVGRQRRADRTPALASLRHLSK